MDRTVPLFADDLANASVLYDTISALAVLAVGLTVGIRAIREGSA